LKQLSIERLRCLLRHWIRADKARARFERELASFRNEWVSRDIDALGL
jgi:hypothetical protein